MSNAQPEEDFEVFISYSHKDNVAPPRPGAQGWVTHFDKLLEFFLREWRGEPRIWRDNMMRGSDVIDDAILTPLPRVAVMIAVLSPNYASSEWCERERVEFCKAARQARPGLQVHNRSRIFMVTKVPLRAGQRLPDEFTRLKGFKFFDDRDKDKRPTFFGPYESTEEAKQLFQDTVGDVAWEVIEMLDIINELAGAENAAAPPAPQQQPAREASVYLAEATPDLTTQRDNVRRDLLHRGYNVVELSGAGSGADEGALRERVRQDLSRCGFSIHLIGNEFGDCPAGGTASVVELQDELAAERAGQSADFQRLIWIPDNVKPQHHSQRRFVNALLELNFARNTELLRRSLEDFKTVILDKLRPPRPEAAQQFAAPAYGTRTVGIVCDRLDAERAARLDDCLFEQGCDVSVVVADGATAALTQEHIRTLSACDAVVVYMDNAPLFWVQSRLQDVAQIERGRREKFRAVTVYVGGRKTDEKERFRRRDAVVVIKNFEDAPDMLLGPIPPHLVRPLLDKLDEEERGQAS
jgi:hypothetical protein